jgi:Holliday junction resolvase
MTNTSIKSKTKHDKKVRSIATRYEAEGYKVEADISGFKTPAPIGKNNRIPDVVAKKNGRTKIIEVETPESLKIDKEQQATFRRSAAHKKSTTFNIEVTK